MSDRTGESNHNALHGSGESQDRREGQVVALTKSFKLRGRVQSATLHLAADFTRCKVSIGDQPLVELDEYAPWIEQDVTDSLAGGVNRLSLECKSGSGPAAVALSLRIDYADGIKRINRHR